MPQEQVKITIDANGAVSIEALGFEDGSCADATKPLEDALLGKKTLKKKPEYDAGLKRKETLKTKGAK